MLQCSRLEKTLVDAPKIQRVFLDLTKTTFIDSYALSTLNRFDQTLKGRGCRLVLIGAKGAVRRLLEDSNLYALFDNKRTKAEVSPEARATRYSNVPLTF